MIKKFNEFVNEGVMTNTLKRFHSNDIRKEDGIVICTTDKGDKLILSPNEIDGDSIIFNNGEKYIFIEEFDTEIVGFKDGDTNVYFYHEEPEEGKINLFRFVESDYDMFDDDLIDLRAIATETNHTSLSEYTEFIFTDKGDYILCEVDGEEYQIYNDHSYAEQAAIEYTKELLTDDTDYERWYDMFGDEVFDTDSLEEFFQEDYENYAEDIESENGEHGNRLFDELIDAGLIEDTEEYFELTKNEDDDSDFEPELDYDSPLFDVDDMKREFAEQRVNDIDGDYVGEYINNFGKVGLENYLDMDLLAEKIVDSDGCGNSLSSYDGKEIETDIDGTTLWIYRIN